MLLIHLSMTPTSISITDLLDAIAKDSFTRSSDQIILAFQKNEIKQIALVLQDIVENDDTPNLKIRDSPKST